MRLKRLLRSGVIFVGCSIFVDVYKAVLLGVIGWYNAFILGILNYHYGSLGKNMLKLDGWRIQEMIILYLQLVWYVCKKIYTQKRSRIKVLQPKPPLVI